MSNDGYYESDEYIKHVDTKDETDRKCPNCEGTMDYNPETKGLKCPYCGYEEEIKINDSNLDKAQELDFSLAEQKGNCDWGAGKKVVICESCGAESVYDELQISNECPYCGSNQVMEEKGKETLAPGGVVPFVITAKEAAVRFKGWIKRRLFCPRKAKQSAKPKAFKGLYLPYWTFDTHTESDYTAQYGKHRLVKDDDGKDEIVTDWYRTSGTYTENIDDQLVIGTNRHDESMLRKIEPFNTADNKTYKPEYVAGFIAERYSIGLKDAWEKAKGFISSRLRSNIRSKILRNHNADEVRNLNIRTSYSRVTYKYLLLPVWISSFRYNDKIYQFVVNGQTGEVAGKSPISPLRVAIAIIIGIVVIGLVYYFYTQG